MENIDISAYVPPRIVCAAIRHKKTRRVIASARHYDRGMIDQIKSSDGRIIIWLRKLLNGNKILGFFKIYTSLHSWIGNTEQGFIDQFCNFYTREEAWIIAKKNNQIIREVSIEGELYSENLY